MKGSSACSTAERGGNGQNLSGNDEWHGPVQEAGLVIKQEPYTMRVPRSQRGGEVVEPLVREQWFVRMQPLAEPALQVLSHNPP